MDGRFPDGELPLLDNLNYFNYFTEVEDEFVRRRGSHMQVAPLDWALIETWKEAGVPLHVALRGINRAFDGRDALPNKYRKVNTIFFCEQQVEIAFAEYRLSRVGDGSSEPEDSSESKKSRKGTKNSSSAGQGSFTKEILLEFIGRCSAAILSAPKFLTASGILEKPKEPNDAEESPLARPLNPDVILAALERANSRLAEIGESIGRAIQVDAESLETDLDAIDRMLIESARAGYGPDRLSSLYEEAKAQLRSYRSKMDKAIYQQTVENFVAGRLREMCHIPRLSVFYI
ncbi:MAG TPA: hypothetical protein VJX67_00915 [Blastocatellia bacterium]|nr:hypothetical protein [Blastocatellia bacterium]